MPTHIRITNPRSHLYNGIYEVRQIDGSGAITLNDNAYFRIHEYELVEVISEKEKAEQARLAEAAKVPLKKPKRFFFF